MAPKSRGKRKKSVEELLKEGRHLLDRQEVKSKRKRKPVRFSALSSSKMAEARNPAAPASTRNTFKKFYRLRKKVMDQKKKKQVIPRDLLKLAGLTAQCYPKKKTLPVCVLCQDTTKKITQLGHYFPLSILKEAGRKEFCNFHLGTSGPVSEMGIRAFCKDCEERFGWGETHLNPEFYKPFLKDDSVENVECKLDSGFPWLFFAMASIIWRCMCFSINSDKVFEAWEDIRKVLLNYKKNEGTGIVEVDEDVTNNIEKTLKLYLISPNHEIDQKLKGAPGKDIYFYKTFHFFCVPLQENKISITNGCALMGPLHIAFVYSKSHEIFESKEYKEIKRYRELDKHRTLTAKTEHFTIEGKETRYYPAFFFEVLCKAGAKLLSECLRAPSQKKTVEGGRRSVHQARKKLLKVEEGQCLSILPEGVSYDNRGNKFNYLTERYKHCKSFNIVTIQDKTLIYHIQKVVRGKEEILFVANPRGLMNGGYVAQALTFPDKKLGYLEGLPTESMKGRVVKWVDLTTPPFLEEIRIVCDRFHVFDTHGKSCPLKKS